ncbi:MAG: hypothetical protein QME60_06425 [Verrucomicrobiota bacterium]|nr:hypothetical protein [Verrucomicrobiota bacterium]
MLTIAACVSLAMVACRTHDYRRAAIFVPEMKNQAAAELIAKALDRLPGIQKNKLILDVDRRQVIVVYDSMEVALKNIEFVICEAGFSANDVPARPEAAAALPPEVRAPVAGVGATNLPTAANR